MFLVGPNGSFHLTILGYQFPHLATEPYDSNWLQVRVEVTHPRGSWNASDPALLTYEAASLAAWLEAVAAGSPAEPECSFLEPCVWFELRDGAGGGRVVRAYFQREFRPPWARGREDDEAAVEVPADPATLRGAASALRAQLREFPQRTAQ